MNLEQLPAGTLPVTETIRPARDGATIRGAAAGKTLLKRGKLADGSLFKGPLIEVAGRSGVRIEGLRIDGGRFERRWLRLFDHRHPLTSSRTAAEFPCSRRIAAPDCYEPRCFGTDVDADIVIVDSHDTEIGDVRITASMSLGIALGPGTRDARLRGVRIERSGQYGVWLGGVLGSRPALPLPDEMVRRLPAGVVLSDCTFEWCGSAGVFLEGRDVTLERCSLLANHGDFPFNEGGGQLVIDYKCEGIVVRACRIDDGAMLTRPVAEQGRQGLRFTPRLFTAVGVEASGRRLAFIDNVMTGNAREAIHLNGASLVTIKGASTRFGRNHRAGGGATQDVTVTTTAEMAQLGAVAGDIDVREVAAGSLLVWSNGSVPGLRVDGVRAAGSGMDVTAGLNPDGSSVKGSGWN